MHGFSYATRRGGPSAHWRWARSVNTIPDLEVHCFAARLTRARRRRPDAGGVIPTDVDTASVVEWWAGARHDGGEGSAERGDAWEGFAFQPFEECTAGGGDVAHFVEYAGMAQCRYGVAAAGDAAQCALLSRSGDGLREGRGCGVEGRCFECTERTVPDQGLQRCEVL